jgi:hypothetical protein
MSAYRVWLWLLNDSPFMLQIREFGKTVAACLGLFLDLDLRFNWQRGRPLA